MSVYAAAIIYEYFKLFYMLVTYQLTYSMEQSPSWEANRFAASQEIPLILWNQKDHFHIHRFPAPVPIQSQLDPVHTPTFHFLKMHLNIILPSVPGFPQWSLSLRFPHQNPVLACPLPHMCHMPRPSHSSWFYHSHNIGWGVQIIKFLIMLVTNRKVKCCIHVYFIYLTKMYTYFYMQFVPCAWSSLKMAYLIQTRRTVEE